MKRIRRSFFIIPIVTVIVACIIATPQTTTPITVADIQKQCLSPQPLPINNTVESNSIFFISTYQGSSDYLWDFEKNSIMDAPLSKSGYKTWGARVSPNRKWIAFEVDKINDNNIVEKYLRVFDAFGMEKSSIVWGENWGVLRQWLDNDRLFIDGIDKDSIAAFIVDPFDNKIKELSSPLPNTYVADPPVYWSILPNSELTLELYLTGSSAGIGYSLWDANLNREIWHLDSRIAPRVEPLWSSDYLQFSVIKEQSVFGNQEDILIVDTSGQVIFQTVFGLKYPYAFVGDKMSFSPDNRYLAAWLSLGNDVNSPSHPSIVLFDLQTGVATDFCMTSFGTGSDLIWSKDGRWLITRPDGVGSNVLVDILENKAFLFPVPVDGTINGWMIKP